MSALENAKKMNAEEIIEKIAASGLMEFGVERVSVAEKWKLVNAERDLQTNPIRVVCGLNNSDINGALLAILKENPEKVMEGMAIAALAVNAEEMFLVVPASEEAYAAELSEKASALSAIIGMRLASACLLFLILAVAS